jgi:hypothetical protein
MADDLHSGPDRPADDHAPLADFDRLRLAMLQEGPPPPAEQLFLAEHPGGAMVLARLRFFRWVLETLYDGSVFWWEASLERRDDRLRRLQRVDAAAGADAREA